MEKNVWFHMGGRCLELCGSCVREVFERKLEREKKQTTKKQSHSAVFANCFLPIWSLEVIRHQGNRISRP